MVERRDFRSQSRAAKGREVIQSTGRFEYIDSIDKKHGIKGVFTVKDSNDGQTKALKILWNTNISRQKAENEWELWREINARNGDTTHIVRVFEQPIKLGKVYGVLMEHAYDSLEGLINDPMGVNDPEEEAMTPEDALRYVKETALGVKEVHTIGMSHSDLKPSNILMFRIPDSDLLYVKIGDFANSTQASHPTSTEKGSKGYMAPEAEKINDDSKCLYTPRSDIYSLGVVLYQLLHPNFETPFDELQGKNLYNAQLQKGQTHIKNKLKEIKAGEELKQIILKCTYPEPDGRYQSIDQFMGALSGEKITLISAYPHEYDQFNTEYEGLMKLLKGKDFHNGNKYGTANIRNIEQVYNSLIRLNELDEKIRGYDLSVYEDQGILVDVETKIRTARDTKYQAAVLDKKHLLETVVAGMDKEKATIRNLPPGREKRKKKKELDKKAIDLFKILLCWGPPVSNPQKDRNYGKERYSHAEINNGTYREALPPHLRNV